MGRAGIERRLEQLARRRTKLDEQQRAASRDLAEAVRQAREAGIPVTQIALKAGISRQAVYDFLEQS